MSNPVVPRLRDRAGLIVPAVLAYALFLSPVWADETAVTATPTATGDAAADAAASGGAPTGDKATGDAAADGRAAVWTEKELTFVYQGFTTQYSCDGLRDKVRGVLLDLGAQKKSLKVMQLGCSSPGGRPDPFPGVRVKMNVLQPAAASNDRQPQVAAHWKPVDLKLRDSFSIDSGECELVEQIRHSIVPLFATRNVELQTNCIPHQATATRPSLKLEVLAPDDVPHPAGEPRATR